MIQMPDTAVVFVDCDETLILWEVPFEEQENALILDAGGYNVICMPHKPHIELLKHFKARGQQVVVWSAGGATWAGKVVKILQLESCVDLVISKPDWLTPINYRQYQDKE